MDNVVTIRGEPLRAECALDYRIALKRPLTLFAAPAPEDQPKRPAWVLYRQIRYRFRAARQFVWRKLLRPVRNRWYRLHGDHLVAELVRLSLKLNRADFHVHVNISGHVESLDLTIHLGGWRKDYARTISFSPIYLPGRSDISKATPRDIEDLMAVTKALSRMNHLYTR